MPDSVIFLLVIMFSWIIAYTFVKWCFKPTHSTDDKANCKPEFVGRYVPFETYDSVRQPDYKITPFPEINWFLEVLGASDNL